MNKTNDELWNKFPEDSLQSQDYQHTEPPVGSVNSSDKGTPEQSTTTDPTNSAIGSGIEGALGMKYTWDTKAEDRANLDYEASVLKSQENFLTNRQELESQGQQMQQQVAMQEYSQNQSNEKAGWTGGYVLDTERQMGYLKQTIQSQMYGAMELQKYGYDTSLASARLAYETNKFDLALKYYNDAVSQALSESDRTGYYVSPEVKEHLSAYSIASKILEDSTSSEADKQRASTVLNGIDKWFEDNGISKQGVATLAQKDFIETLKKTAESMITYTGDEEIFQIDWDTVVKVDGSGAKQFTKDNRAMETLTFSKMSIDQILEYATVGETAKQQVFGYIDNLLERDIQNYLDSVKKETKDSEGKVTYTYDTSDTGLQAFLETHSLPTINKFLEQSKTNPDTSNLFDSYNLNTSSYDNTNVYFTVIDGKIAIGINNNPEQQTGGSDNNDNNNNNSLPKEADGMALTIDSKTGTAYNTLYNYKLNDTRDNWVVTGYNTNNMTEVKNHLASKFGHSVSDTTINVRENKSTWGDSIKQQDFNKDKSEGKAGEYIDAIIKAEKEGKIPLGAVIQFNYGVVWSDHHTYTYIGNGVFIEMPNHKNPTFVPDGFKWDNGIKKK